VPNITRKYAAVVAGLAAQLALASFLAFPAAGYSWDPPQKKPFLIKTRVRYWWAASSAKTRAYVLTPPTLWTPPTDNIAMGRTDDFRRMDTSFPLYSAEIEPVYGLSAEFEIGDSSFRNGSSAQHSWLNSDNRILYLHDDVVWITPNHQDYSLATAKLTGSSKQYSANLYMRLYKSRPKHAEEMDEFNHSIDLFVGYSWYETKTSLTNGYQALSTGFFVPTPPTGPFGGMNSTAKMSWYGWRAGLREQATLSDKFSAEGKVSFGPGVRFTGEDFWNLRADLMDPGLRQTAHGLLTEFSTTVSWNVWEQLDLEGGYMVWAYQASSGSETAYYIDGTTQDMTLDRVRGVRKGFFLALSWKY